MIPGEAGSPELLSHLLRYNRMVSCGWDNIRLWRLRSRALKFCPVNLEEHHQMHFTDISFEAGYHDNGDITDRFM